jgi:hypothetical protein
MHFKLVDEGVEWKGICGFDFLNNFELTDEIGREIYENMQYLHSYRRQRTPIGVIQQLNPPTKPSNP